MENDGGQATIQHKVPVRFGDRPTQELHHESAEKGLKWLYANRRQAFADMMLHINDLDFTTKPRANGNRP